PAPRHDRHCAAHRAGNRGNTLMLRQTTCLTRPATLREIPSPPGTTRAAAISNEGCVPDPQATNGRAEERWTRTPEHQRWTARGRKRRGEPLPPPFRSICQVTTRNRGAPRLGRGATSVGGFGGPCRGPPCRSNIKVQR